MLHISRIERTDYNFNMQITMYESLMSCFPVLYWLNTFLKDYIRSAFMFSAFLSVLTNFNKYFVLLIVIQNTTSF